MNENSIAFKTFIDAHCDFLTARGFGQKEFKTSSLVSEYTFHSDTIGIRFNAEWRDMFPDISIIRIGTLGDLDSYRFNEDKTLKCLRLPEILDKLKISSSDFYGNKNERGNVTDVLDLTLRQITLLKTHLDTIITNLDSLFSHGKEK